MAPAERYHTDDLEPMIRARPARCGVGVGTTAGAGAGASQMRAPCIVKSRRSTLSAHSTAGARYFLAAFFLRPAQ